MSVAEKRGQIQHGNGVSITQQCAALGLARSSYYYQPVGESDYNLELMRLIDEQYLQHPAFGIGQMTQWLRNQGHRINHKRIARLMRLMGLQGAVPGPHTSKPHPMNPVYPYLLRGMTLTHSQLVWSTDITFVPMPTGFMYLVAVIDWFSRYVLAWTLSNSMDVRFCIVALRAALEQGEPCIFNTDQGSQFTSREFTDVLLDRQILISMDGRGRALDNVFIERLWRTVKYEDIYLKGYETVLALETGLQAFFQFYNHERPHSALQGKTPYQVHWSHLPET